MTGRELIYTALVGKPSEITYRHGEHVLQEQAKALGIQEPIKHIYCIGDNVCTDIFGANLYHKYLQKRIQDTKLMSQSKIQNLGQGSRSIENLIGAEVGMVGSGATSCFSVLVETGVYSSEGVIDLNHSPRDFLPAETCHKEPSFTTKNVYEAVSLILERENNQ